MRVLQTGAGKQVLGQAGSFFALEVPGELVAETGNTYVDYQYGHTDDKTPADFINSLPTLWRDTLAETIIGGGAQVAGTAAVRKLGENLTKAPPELAPEEVGSRPDAGQLNINPIQGVAQALAAPARAVERYIGDPVREGLHNISERRVKAGRMSVANEVEPQIQQGGNTPRDFLVVEPDLAIDMLDPQNKVAGVAAVGFNMDKIEGPEDLKAAMLNVSQWNAEEIKQFKRGRWLPQDVRRRMMLEDKVKYDEGIQSWNLNEILKNDILANKEAFNRMMGRPKGAAVNAPEMAAMMQANVDAAVNPWMQAKRIVEKQNNNQEVTEQELLQLQLALQKSAWVSAVFANRRAEAGRALNILKRTTKMSKDPQQVREAMEQAVGGNAREWLQDVAVRLAGTTDLNHAQQFIRDTRYGQGPVHAVWLSNMLSSPLSWVTNLYSGVGVMAHQGIEDIGGAMMGSARINGARIKALGYMAKGVATGNMRQAMNQAQMAIGRAKADSTTWSDLWAQYKPISMNGESLGSDMLDGLLVAANVFTTGQEIDPMASVLEHGGDPGTQITTLSGKKIPYSSFLTIPQRVLAATDNLFKTIVYQGNMRKFIRQEARRMTQQQMESSQQRWTRAQQQLYEQQQIDELTKFKPRELSEKAWEQARYVTFTNPLGHLGRKIMDMRRMRYYDAKAGKWRMNLGGVALTAAMPFLRTPVNIVKYMADRGAMVVPAGLIGTATGGKVQTRIDDILHMRGKNTKQDRDKLLAGFAINGAITYGFVQMALSGLLTGEAPDDPEERETWLGHMAENSLRNPETGEYMELRRLDPLGGWATSLATGVGKLQRMYESGEIDQKTTGALVKDMMATFSSSLLQVMSDKSSMEGVASMMDWLTGKSNKPFLSTISSMVVPNWFGDMQVLMNDDPLFKKAITPVGRDVENLPAYDRWLMNLNNMIVARTDSPSFGRNKLANRIDIYGNVRPQQPYLGPDENNKVALINRLKAVTNPAPVGRKQFDPILADMQQLGYMPQDPQVGNFKRWGMPLEEDEIVIYKQSRNRAAWNVLNKVRSAGYWERYNDAQKLFVLKRAWDIGRTVGDVSLLKSKPGLIRVRAGYKMAQRMERLLGPTWRQQIDQNATTLIDSLKKGQINVPWESEQ